MSTSLHRARGNPRVGMLLALATVLLWGLLAIALRLLVRDGMDAFTITWYRMIASTVLLGGFQAYRGQLPSLRGRDRRIWGLLAIALAGLLGNYVLFAASLDYVPPATAQLVIQIAPILFLIGSVAIFREPFSGPQSVGLVALLVGLLLFFNDRLGALASLSGAEATGVAIVVLAAIVWASYALAQKQLLLTFSSENILLLIYVGATVLLIPVASPSQIAALGGFEWALLAFAIFNTLAAYGCFAEALEHWEASRVSAVIALTPLVTLFAVYLILTVWPTADVGARLDPIAIVGAVFIVGGSAITAMWRQAKRVAPVDME